MKHKKFIIATLAVLLVSIGTAIHLTDHHYWIHVLQSGEASFCNIASYIDCDAVAQSDFAKLWGMPVSSIGIFAYVFMFLIFGLAFFSRPARKKEMFAFLYVISFLMLLFSLYEFGASVFVVKSVCIMCFVLYVCAALLFVFYKKLSEASVTGAVKNAGLFVAGVFKKPLYLLVMVAFLGASVALAWGIDRHFDAKYAAMYDERYGAGVSEPGSARAAEIIAMYEALDVFDIDVSGAPMKGAADAPVTVVEFSDFQCPGCQVIAGLLKEIVDYYDGRVRLFFKHHPLSHECNKDVLRPFNLYACVAAKHAVCAHQQNQFWPLHELLFASDYIETYVIEDMVRALGLDQAAFARCMRDDAEKLVQRDLDQGHRLGIHYTPTVFINNRRVSDIARRYVDYQIVIEYLLEKHP